MNNCSGLQAMIISGGVGQNRGVEVISPSGNVSCSLPNLPGAGRKDHTQDKGLICGGYLATGNTLRVLSFSYFFDDTSSNVSHTCLNLTSSGWVHTKHFLRHPGRTGHSSWAVDDGIILMGGDDVPYLFFRHMIRRYSPVNTAVLVKFDGTTEETFGLKYSETT